MHARSSHLNEDGQPRMVDVGSKPTSVRSATAQGCIHMSRAAFDVIGSGANPKGDPLATARIAAIQAAKRTAELIPLCHPLAIDAVDVEVLLDPEKPSVCLRATVRATARTGVEMEALTAVSIGLLTVYDMLKGIDPELRIAAVRLLHKAGGTTGVGASETSGGMAVAAEGPEPASS
ncbi:MAG: cyclic pyranopterin monophosphate synthase MoaC [Longimicrobiales bacterium]